MARVMLMGTLQLANTIFDHNDAGNGTSNTDSVTIVDVRAFGEYARGHIPGAVNLDLFAFHWNDTTMQGIADFQRYAARLFSFAGIDCNKTTVVYDGQSGMLAARGVWMLLYMSCPRVCMLDGGFSKWCAESRATETRTNAPIVTNFQPRPDPSIIAGYQYVAENLERLAIIDARSPLEYSGSTVRAARPGHIPGAINIEWTQNLADDGTLRDAASLEELYGDIQRSSEVVTYCQGAYRAANSFLALKKAGFENVRVYLGSWGEWGNMPELPVEL